MPVRQPEQGTSGKGEGANVPIHHGFGPFPRVDEPHQHVRGHRGTRTLRVDQHRVFNSHAVQRVARLFDNPGVSVDVAEVSDGHIGDQGSAPNGEVAL